jgi:50S ribosomal protein L16 3-hydroxylase
MVVARADSRPSRRFGKCLARDVSQRCHIYSRRYNPSMEEAPLGGLSPRAFLRRYWQKRPLLVRRALPAARKLMSRRELLALAARDDVESRLVERRLGRWRVTHGPLARLPRGGRDWTVLVNGVNLHCDAAERLLRRFSFIPQARLDDVMASYAAPGGGGGPHFDSYDVFLVQGAGRRVWRLSRRRGFATVPDAPLRLIAGFRAEEEYLLEPGDLLYLPPGWGHDGVALEPCFTYSVGFRAPQGAELGAAFLDYLHERGLPDARYRDPGLAPARRAARIGRELVDFAQAQLGRIRWRRGDIERFMGEYLSAPKPQVVFAPPRKPLARAAFARRLARRDAVLDARTQLLYRGARLFLNGEALSPRPDARRALCELADRRRIAGRTLARRATRDLVYEWYLRGTLRLEAAK